MAQSLIKITQRSNRRSANRKAWQSKIAELADVLSRAQRYRLAAFRP